MKPPKYCGDPETGSLIPKRPRLAFSAVIFRHLLQSEIFPVFALAAVLLSGCVSPIDHRPLTTDEFQQVDYAALAPYRSWADEPPVNLERQIERLAPILRNRYDDGTGKAGEERTVLNSLVISGGGANGAFGAGLLAGWSESGSRPEFNYVTGVSTGAIMAPFAFLGPEYDTVLLDLYSSTEQDDIFIFDRVRGFLFGSAVADTSPMRQSLARVITPEVVERIALERERGRTLSIVTTHLDANRPVLWDITAMAQMPMDRALPLIRDVILASSAIPAFFPPVSFSYDWNGKRFTELHVDGAVTRQVYAYPPQIRLETLNGAIGRKFTRRLYVLQNSNIDPLYEPAPTGVTAIAERALDTLLLNQLNGDVERIYFLAERDGFDFRMIAIPSTFRADGSTNFDRGYMNSLIELGRSIGRSGDFWMDTPPSLAKPTSGSS